MGWRSWTALQGAKSSPFHFGENLVPGALKLQKEASPIETSDREAAVSAQKMEALSPKGKGPRSLCFNIGHSKTVILCIQRVKRNPSQLSESPIKSSESNVRALAQCWESRQAVFCLSADVSDYPTSLSGSKQVVVLGWWMDQTQRRIWVGPG